ncbi:MAG: PEP-CTERM sorting domain-containing protein [Sedimentisphaerales bacterium]
MKKFITVCLVCVLTAAVWGNIIINFDENGQGYIEGGSSLTHGTAAPSVGGHATLYYDLPASVTVGDVNIVEPENPYVISDVLRFADSRVYVYSEREEEQPPYDLADTGIPTEFLSNVQTVIEQGSENGWNGVNDVLEGPDPGEPGYMELYGFNGVHYNFTSDVPEPATICLLALGSLAFIKGKK